MKKTIRVVSLLLSLLLCVGLLASCGTDETGTNPAAQKNTDYAFGQVTALDKDAMTLQVYTSNSGKVKNIVLLSIDQLSATEETTDLTISGDAQYFYTDNGSLFDAEADIVAEGSLIASRYCEGVQQIVVLNHIPQGETLGYSMVARVTGILDSQENTFLVARYKLAADSDYAVTDYASVDFTQFEEQEGTVALEITEETKLDVAEGGALEPAQITDIAIGDFVILYTVEDSAAVVFYHQ